MDSTLNKSNAKSVFFASQAQTQDQVVEPLESLVAPSFWGAVWHVVVVVATVVSFLYESGWRGY